MKKSLLLLYALFSLIQLSAQKKFSDTLRDSKQKKMHFFLNKKYSQIIYNEKLKIDEPLDSIVVDSLGLYSIKDFKQQYPQLDSIQFSLDIATAYQLFNKSYSSSNETGWDLVATSKIRRIRKELRIYERIEDMLIDWKSPEPTNKIEYAVGVKLISDVDLSTMSFYALDITKHTLIRFGLDKGNIQHCNLNKNRQFLLVLFDIKGDNIICARKYINTDQPKEIQLSFKEIPLNDLESCFEIH